MFDSTPKLKKCKNSYCKRFPQAGYKTCTEHLESARLGWHENVRARNAAGKCCSCDEPKLPGEQRGAACKLKNRRKCHRWTKSLNASRRRDGLCRLCLVTNPKPAVPGSCFCEDCRPYALARLKLGHYRVKMEAKGARWSNYVRPEEVVEVFGLPRETPIAMTLSTRRGVYHLKDVVAAVARVGSTGC